ncbi:unnamed protein product [Auanema sp. JU1783]|nr:unnamed protein product [Auanema sp. JU1783]
MEPSSSKRKKTSDAFSPTVFEDLKTNFEVIEQRASLFHKLNDILTTSYAQNKSVNDNVHQGYKDAIEINKDNINNTLSDLTKKLESLGIQKAENFERRRHEFLEHIKSVTQNASTLYAVYEKLFNVTRKSKEALDNIETTLRKDLENLKSKSDETRARGDSIQQEISRIGNDEETEMEQTGIFRDITTTESEQITHENNAEAAAHEELENCRKQLHAAKQHLQVMNQDKCQIECDVAYTNELLSKVSEQLSNERCILSSLQEELQTLSKSSDLKTQNKCTEENISNREQEIDKLKELITGLRKELEITENIDINALTEQLESKFSELSEAIDVLKAKMSEMQTFKEKKEEEEKLVLEELRNEEKRITQTFSELDTANQQIEKKNQEMVQTVHNLRLEIEKLKERKMMLDKSSTHLENSKSSSQRVSSTSKNPKMYRTPVTLEPRVEKKKNYHNSSGEEDVSSCVPEIDGIQSFSPKTINKKKQKESKAKKREGRRTTRLSKQLEEAKESNISSDHSFSNIPRENVIENRFPHDMYLLSSELLEERTSAEMNVSGFDDNANSTIGSMLF